MEGNQHHLLQREHCSLRLIHCNLRKQICGTRLKEAREAEQFADGFNARTASSHLKHQRSSLDAKYHLL